ncbi:nucleotidyl transferase AbiEii/AbiGii toxin family protein [soil metagenome]
MSRLEAALRDLADHLASLEARFAVVGGLAISARAEPRFTRDADICVSVGSDEEAERLVASLRGHGLVVMSIIEQEATRRVAAVRLGHRAPEAADVPLDLLFASSGVEPEVVATADRLELFDGLVVPVATVPSLIALKILSRDDARRPQDQVDLSVLRRLATTAELERARALLVLIGERGFGRGRDLLGAMDAFEREGSAG